jgi:tRNA threonylcarbamoyladenosine biosynthesis protein TsaE
VVLLEGDLGAGKTTFVQGVAEALGVEEAVTSPTFVLARPYACARGPGAESASGIDTLWHADVYRLEHLREVWDLDLAELVDEDAVAFVEWGDRAAPALGADALRVLIEVTSTASSVGDHPERSVSFVAARGSSWAERLEKLDSDRGLPAASGAQPERGGQPGC